MMYKQTEIVRIMSEYEKLYEKIKELVELSRKKDDLYYSIRDIQLENEIISVEVEFYKWQTNNDRTLFFNINLLTDKEHFDEFKAKVESIVQEREEKKSAELEKKKQKEIDDALAVLKKNGVLENGEIK